MKFITLMTDFGENDGFTGVMKGVIWGIAPDAQVGDITHAIGAQDVLQGAIVLSRSAPFFPPGTIHVAVVDPGVGTQRRPIAARLGEHFFVGPDNGLCSLLLEAVERRGEAVQVVHLDRPEFWRAEISNVFHGRDIFAPVAAHLANGASLEQVGTPVSDVRRLQLPPVTATGDGWRGGIILVDYFGNLVTNLGREQMGDSLGWRVRLRGVDVPGMVRTFGERPPGTLVALIGEADDLELAVVNGSAAKRLGAQVGDLVEVFPLE